MSLKRSVAIGFALLAGPALAFAQPTTKSSSSSQPRAASGQEASAEALPVSLDRIREGVMRDSRITLPDFGVPTFRIEVQQETIKLPGQYDKRNAVGNTPGYYFSNAHQEFLNMSSPSGTPVQPQAAGGIPVFALVSALKKGFREREAARIRSQIRDELEQIDPEAARTLRNSSPPRD